MAGSIDAWGKGKDNKPRAEITEEARPGRRLQFCVHCGRYVLFPTHDSTTSLSFRVIPLEPGCTAAVRLPLS